MDLMVTSFLNACVVILYYFSVCVSFKQAFDKDIFDHPINNKLYVYLEKCLYLNII